MKIIRNAISILLVSVLLLCCAVVVSAEETQIDWSNVDLESIDDKELEHSQWLSLREWLQEDADLHTVFYVTTTKGDGYVGELWSTLLYSLFKEDPVPFIQALALEDEATQNGTISFLLFEANATSARDEFNQLMRTLALPDSASAADRNVLQKIISDAKEIGIMDSTIPKTGDSFGFTPLLMVASALGIAVLVKRRKLAV